MRTTTAAGDEKQLSAETTDRLLSNLEAINRLLWSVIFGCPCETAAGLLAAWRTRA